MMIPGLDWEREGAAWPNRSSSRFVRSGEMRWHVQIMGHGPVMLLVHGTGASTHSWRRLAPLLSRRFTVVAMDLPGHAFTQTPAAFDLSLPAMARGVARLLADLDLQVEWAVGHSAGAAIVLSMVLDRSIAPVGMIGLNAAVLPMAGAAGLLFPAAARLLAVTPLPAWLFTRRASQRSTVERLIASTGSRLDAQGVDLYAMLLRDFGHVNAVLRMMAQWELGPLVSRLGRIQTPLSLLVGHRDLAVPPSSADRVVGMLPRSTPSRITLACDGGHLVHEERSESVARYVFGLVGPC